MLELDIDLQARTGSKPPDAARNNPAPPRRPIPATRKDQGNPAPSGQVALAHATHERILARHTRWRMPTPWQCSHDNDRSMLASTAPCPALRPDQRVAAPEHPPRRTRPEEAATERTPRHDDPGWSQTETGTRSPDRGAWIEQQRAEERRGAIGPAFHPSNQPRQGPKPPSRYVTPGSNHPCMGQATRQRPTRPIPVHESSSPRPGFPPGPRTQGLASPASRCPGENPCRTPP